MTKEMFLREFEELLEAAEGSLSEDVFLKDVAGWDSLAIMAFIAMIDEKFNYAVSPANIFSSKTIGDLMGLLGDNIS
jgi:acyl carrier protein